MEIINKVKAEAIPAPMPREFVFKLTEEAPKKNFMILKRYDFDLAKAIHAQRLSQLVYGSEFRLPKTLMKIFKHHPLCRAPTHQGIQVAINRDKQKQQNCRSHRSLAVWEPQRSFTETGSIKEVGLR
jgi:hypothetical protein